MFENIQQSIIANVLNQPPHEDVSFKKGRIPHPLYMGFRSDLGEPIGQIGDYRLALKDGRSIHAREFNQHWSFHWDRVDPAFGAIEHLRRDSPGYYTLGCASAGAITGAAIGSSSKDKDNVLFCTVIFGMLGLIFGLATAEWE